MTSHRRDAEAADQEGVPALEKIKRLAMIAVFSDDTFLDRLVLKGGNALDLIYGMSTRASMDIDLSLDGDFTEGCDALRSRMERVLQDTFRPEGFRVFDVRVEARPAQLTPDVEDFWGGYGTDFKVIPNQDFEKFQGNLEVLRRHALIIGSKAKFSIEISKHEYTAGKIARVLDGYRVFVYSPEMIVCEKLRAICQQMVEYAPTVKRSHRPGSSRARDFVDIHSVLSATTINLTTPHNQDLLRLVFQAKRVPLELLRQVGREREFHRTSFHAVRDAVKPGIGLKDFDFYVDFVLGIIGQLEPFGNV